MWDGGTRCLLRAGNGTTFDQRSVRAVLHRGCSYGFEWYFTFPWPVGARGCGMLPLRFRKIRVLEEKDRASESITESLFYHRRHHRRHLHHHHHHKWPSKLSSTPSPFPRLHPPPKGHYRHHLLHHALPLPRHLSPPRMPMLVRPASVVVHFYLLPDRNGLVCKQRSVETTQFRIVTAVDDGHGGHVFSAQAGDGVDVVPVCGVGWAVLM